MLCLLLQMMCHLLNQISTTGKVDEKSGWVFLDLILLVLK
jgi:hypothetical protein